MKSWTAPTDDMIEKVLLSVKKETDRHYFFTKLLNPLWLKPLKDRGYFNSPPGIKNLPNGYIQYPDWPELSYLVNIAEEAPEGVIDIILGLPKSDNPKVYDRILDIATKLKGQSSAKLLPKIVEYTEIAHQFLAHRYPNIIQHWINQGNFDEAIEVIKLLVPFTRDPEEKVKQRLRKKNPYAFNTLLKPSPRFNNWHYIKLLEKGVRPLAEKMPYKVASILIDATASMICMTMHPEEVERRRYEDRSIRWCRRLDRSERVHKDDKEILVQTMTYACEQVYEKSPESIEVLDHVLRKKQWKVFNRLRQHLYARYPSDKTLPWIREFILGHKDYSNGEYHYEFQLMIRKACEYFGPNLLNDDEKTAIFDAILNGPSKDDFRKWMGADYSEDAFAMRQSYFRHVQLRPFAALLSGEYKRYFDELEKEKEKEISDESYLPEEGRGGVVTYKSPKSAEDLEELTDEGLLEYINDWDYEHRDKDDWLVRINMQALADVFQSLFKSRIIPDEKRLAFWMENREKIKRPIYVATMLKAMQELVKEKNFNGLEKWVEFCGWVLLHQDQDREEGQPEPRDDSIEHPDWRSSRREVVDFIEICIKDEVDAPISARDGLARLLCSLCTDFDWRLDRDRPVFLNHKDQIDEAINNTRSLSLKSLIDFGFWVRRKQPDDPLPEVIRILSKRLDNNAIFSLTRPEYAILGMQFGNIYILNMDWAAQNSAMLFPKNNMTVWRDAFDGYIRFNNPFKPIFDILQGDFKFALDNLNALAETKAKVNEFADNLGQHLFAYCLWQAFPLTGPESLLEKFYEKTKDDRQRWANLFDHVGRALSHSGKHLEKGLIERVIAYFDWRFAAAEPLELMQFTFWLEAECLEPEWRLKSYSNILDFKAIKQEGLFTELETLKNLFPDHLPLVVECFRKITDTIDQNSPFYILADETKPILKAGLNADDEEVRKNAEAAREKLLRAGRFEFLDLE